MTNNERRPFWRMICTARRLCPVSNIALSDSTSAAQNTPPLLAYVRLSASARPMESCIKRLAYNASGKATNAGNRYGTAYPMSACTRGLARTIRLAPAYRAISCPTSISAANAAAQMTDSNKKSPIPLRDGSRATCTANTAASSAARSVRKRQLSSICMLRPSLPCTSSMLAPSAPSNPPSTSTGGLPLCSSALITEANVGAA